MLGSTVIFAFDKNLLIASSAGIFSPAIRVSEAFLFVATSVKFISVKLRDFSRNGESGVLGIFLK